MTLEKKAPPLLSALLALAVYFCQSSLWPLGRHRGSRINCIAKLIWSSGDKPLIESCSLHWGQYFREMACACKAWVAIRKDDYLDTGSGTPMVYCLAPPNSSRDPVPYSCHKDMSLSMMASDFFFLPAAPVRGCYLFPLCCVSLLFKTKGNKAINCVVCRRYGHSVWETL